MREKESASSGMALVLTNVAQVYRVIESSRRIVNRMRERGRTTLELWYHFRPISTCVAISDLPNMGRNLRDIEESS